jgi:hypothetical protein
MKTPCQVTMNGKNPTSDEEWEDFGEAVKFCDATAKRGECTYYKIDCVFGTLTHGEEVGQ